MYPSPVIIGHILPQLFRSKTILLGERIANRNIWPHDCTASQHICALKCQHFKSSGNKMLAGALKNKWLQRYRHDRMLNCTMKNCAAQKLGSVPNTYNLVMLDCSAGSWINRKNDSTQMKTILFFRDFFGTKIKVQNVRNLRKTVSGYGKRARLYLCAHHR